MMTRFFRNLSLAWSIWHKPWEAPVIGVPGNGMALEPMASIPLWLALDIAFAIKSIGGRP